MLRSRHALPAISLVLAFLSACSPSGTYESYTAALESARASKDEMLRTSPTSPVPTDKRSTILPLNYFPPDESYRVPAGLQPAAASATAEVTTSTGQQRRMSIVGMLAFTLKGQRLKLTAFAEEGSNGERLFVPFTDGTTGTETYGAGRYLDLDRAPTGIYVIDFNTAYNPYCAYNPSYDCPVPPPQNKLPIPVRAGEKKPGGHLGG